MGVFLDLALNIICICSSLTFIVLTYYDVRRFEGNCCKPLLESYDTYLENFSEEVAPLLPRKEYIAANLDPSCKPACNEYFWLRMPPIFNYIDFVICVFLATMYSMRMYIAPNRCHYFLKLVNLADLLLVIIPPIFGIFNSAEVGQLLLTVISAGRVFRFQRIQKVTKICFDSEQSEVGAQVQQIATEMMIMLYMAAGMFMILENLYKEEDERYVYFTYFYMTFVTFMTIGYGDIYPEHYPARIFCSMVVLYVCVYYLPSNLTKLIILMNKKSPYERDKYTVIPEIDHVVISGHV
jgi:hypothetical protein